MSEVFFHHKADKELMELSKRKQEKIYHEVKMFKKKGTSYRDFDMVETSGKLELYRLKVKEDKPIDVNQRLLMEEYYDQWVVYAVKNRDEAYKKSTLTQILDRRYNV